MTVHSTTTLRDVRLHLCLHFRLHPEEQVLVLAGSVPVGLCDDSLTLAALGVDEASQLALYPRALADGRAKMSSDDIAEYVSRTAAFASADASGPAGKSSAAVENGFRGSRLVSSTDARGGDAGPAWACPVCTFLNAPSAAACDMCDTARPAAAA